MPEQLQIAPRRDPQLQCVNEKIAALAAVKPCADIYAAFSFAARLAAEAIEATEELQQLPGASVEALQPTLEFLYRTRDYNYAAALAVVGGNQSLAEALVTFRFLRKAAGEGGPMKREDVECQQEEAGEANPAAT